MTVLEVGFGLQRIDGRLVHGETKTEASDAILPLPDICVTALQLRQKTQAQSKADAGPFWSDTGYVFTTRDGLPLDRGTSTEPSNGAATWPESVPSGFMTHATCGSLLAALDVHPRVAMQILRHSKIAVTMEIYTHVPSDLTRTALRKLGDRLDGLGE